MTPTPLTAFADADVPREGPSDDLLMLAVTDGDPQAFATLVRRYEGPVRRIAGALLRDEERAREAAQEVFLRLWQARGRYRAEGKLRQFLFTIARNTCQSHRRRHALRFWASATELDLEARADEALDPEGPGPRLDRERLVRAALWQLDEALRVAVALRYFAGLEYEEIAEIIGRKPATARSRVFLGLRRLAELLGPELDDEVNR